MWDRATHENQGTGNKYVYEPEQSGKRTNQHSNVDVQRKDLDDSHLQLGIKATKPDLEHPRTHQDADRVGEEPTKSTKYRVWNPSAYRAPA